MNKTVVLLRRIHNILPRSAFPAIWRCFVRVHLDYSDIIYDKAFDNSFHHKIESLQYNADLAITDAIGGTSRELGLDSLQQRIWYRKLCIFFKIYKIQCSK